MNLVQEAGSSPITQFSVPYKGTWNSTAAHQLTPDTLFDSLNIFIRRGKLRRRPGLLLLNSTVFDAPVIGGAMAVTPVVKTLLSITKSQLYTLTPSDTTWQSDTTTSFAFSDKSVIDICFLETSSQYVAIIANKDYLLKRWIQGSGATPIVPSTGVVPSASSICTAARRIIALIPPHTLVWSSTFDYTSWPALATAGKIAQTNDTAICIRSLGTLDFVIYKERSIYVAKAQAGSDASAFNIRFLQRVEGPAGIHAVIDVGGIHYFMTKNGRIGEFDGSTMVKWVADGLWLFLQDDIDPVYSSKIFGIYDYRLHTVTFYYPKVGDAGLLKGMVIINLPLEGVDLQTFTQLGVMASRLPSTFLGYSGMPCSYGYEMRFDDQIDQSLIFTSTSGDCQSFMSDEDTGSDDGTLFNCVAQTGLFPVPDMKNYQFSIESFLERSMGNGQVSVQAVTSQELSSEGGDVDSYIQVIDLNNRPVREYIGFNKPCRFFGLRYTWRSDSTVKYAGATVYGRMLS